MSIEIKVPSLGESVTEAIVGKWLVKEGDFVKQDQNLVELETDKVTLEVTAPSSGIIGKISSKTGDTVEIGAQLGLITEGEHKVSSEQPAPVSAAPVPTANKEVTNIAVNNEVIMAPSAKKIAAENNINPNSINPTGKDGRVTKGDVLNTLAAPSSEKLPPLKPSSFYVSENDKLVEIVPMTRLRKRIAERLKESQNTAAILTTFNEVDMYNIMNMRNQHKESFEKKHGVKMGFMSFFVKASIAALKEIPSVNAEINGDNIIYKNYYDIGVAVGTEQGLVVPVVRNADRLGFAGIEKEIGNLAKKARDGKLSMAELTGGTFTITNGGVYGSLMSTPIINPPQVGILGMHKTQERPVVVNGQVVIRPMMYIALSYDHRIIDGKEAVTFLVKVKDYIENPEKLLLEL